MFQLRPHYVLAVFTIIIAMPLNTYAEDTSKLFEEGYGYYQRGEYADAISTLKKIVEIKQSSQEDLADDYINTLVYLGSSYYAIADYNNALSHYSQALNLVEKIDGQELYCSALLNCMGNCCVMQQDYSRALDLFQRELAIKEILRKEVRVVDYTACLYNIGLCYSYLGNFEKSLDFHLKCLDIRSTYCPNNESGYLASLHSVGTCYKEIGDYNTALAYYKKKLSVELDNTNWIQNYSQTYIEIGDCYSELRDFDEALKNYLEALRLIERIVGKNHQDCLKVLVDLGRCYRDLNDFHNAILCFQESLSICKGIWGIDNPAGLYILNQMGITYSALSEHYKALKYFRQSSHIVERIYGKRDEDYIISQKLIAGELRALGDYKSSLQIHQELLASGLDDDAAIQAGLSLDYFAMGDYQEGLKYALNAQKNSQLNLHTLISIAYYMLGDFPNALGYSEQSLLFSEKEYGTNSFMYFYALQHAFQLIASSGEYNKASEKCVLLYDSAQRFILQIFKTLPEQSRYNVWDNFKQFFTDDIFNFASLNITPEINRYAYNAALFGKGILLNTEIEMRKLILESGDNEAVRMYDELRNCQLRLDKLQENAIVKEKDIDSLQQDIENRQHQLINRSKDFGDFIHNLAIKWIDVQSSLKKKDIAIEFANYTRNDTTFYVALTVKADYTEPHLIQLFNDKELNGISPKSHYQSTDLTYLVWGHLKEEVASAKNVYFSPVGELNNIGIEYLTDWDGKHILSEKKNYYRLSSTRELTRKYSTSRINNATVYGGIDYDAMQKSKLSGNESASEMFSHTASRSYIPIDSLNLSRGYCEYLPGSKVEAESISTLLSSKNVQYNLIEGKWATEESFRALNASQMDIIHIATHGFYWTEKETERAVNRNFVQSFSFLMDRRNLVSKEDKSLTRSGLLFAGAKNTIDGKKIPVDVDDGILTAREISKMDLRGTNLVVLSACQSGLGDITGEGVFGLQRGFKKAGVHSIVMSLWKVNDDATKVMMTRFYENLANGRSKYDAFRDAQKYLRKYNNGEYDNPYYYAAFVILDAID